MPVCGAFIAGVLSARQPRGHRPVRPSVPMGGHTMPSASLPGRPARCTHVPHGAGPPPPPPPAGVVDGAPESPPPPRVSHRKKGFWGGGAPPPPADAAAGFVE